MNEYLMASDLEGIANKYNLELFKEKYNDELVLLHSSVHSAAKSGAYEIKYSVELLSSNNLFQYDSDVLKDLYEIELSRTTMVYGIFKMYLKSFGLTASNIPRLNKDKKFECIISWAGDGFYD